MAERPPINPFANLQPDPTAGRLATDSANNLARMRQAIQTTQMNNAGALARTNATNLNNMKLEGVRQMLSGLAQKGKIDPETAAKMTGMFGAKQALTSGQAADAYRSSGIGLKFPKRVFKPGDFSAQPLRGGFDLKGVSQVKAANKATTGKKTEKLTVGGKDLGITKETETSGTETKNTPPADIASNLAAQKQIRELIKDNPFFDGKKVTDFKVHRGRLAAKVDGVLMYLDP